MRSPGHLRGVGAPKRAAARLAAILVTILALAPHVSAAPKAEVVPQLGPAFGAIRGTTAPLSATAAQLGRSVAAAQAAIDAQAGSFASQAGSLGGTAAGLVITAVALAISQASIVPGTAAPEIAAAGPVVADLAAMLDGQAAQARVAARTLDPYLTQIGRTLPASDVFCSTKIAARSVFTLTPYGYVFEGFLIPLGEACAGEPLVAASSDESPLAPVAAEAGALNGELLHTLEPLSPVLQPVTDPGCALARPIVLAAAPPPAYVPVPIPVGLIFAPAVMMCAFGEGPDALGSVVVLGAAATGPAAAIAGSTSGVAAMAAPLITPLQPLTAPLSSPYCNSRPTLGAVARILWPLGPLSRPALLLSPVDSSVCA